MIHRQLDGGATVVFDFRSIGWGCFYTAEGVYTRGVGPGETPVPWHSAFKDNSDPRIVLEVNSDGDSDNWVTYGNNGGTLTVRIEGGLPTTIYAVQLSDAANGSPPGDVDFSCGTSVQVGGGGGSTQVYLHGRNPGGVTISAWHDDMKTDHDHPATVGATVIDVDHIEVYGEDSWQEKDSIVILQGTKYTFKAVPTTGSFPSGKPTWSGAASGTGETIEVSFPSLGTYSLTASLDDHYKTIAIEVIKPAIDEVRFVSSGTAATAYDIFDGEECWRASRSGQSAINDPGCFKRGGNTAVRVKVWHSSAELTFDTEVLLKGDVASSDHYITGNDYEARVTFAKGGWDIPPAAIESSASTSNYVDYDTDVDIAWSYNVFWGTNTSIGIGDSDNLQYRIVWDSHKNGAPVTGLEAFGDTHYTKSHVTDACQWGWRISNHPTTVEGLADLICNSVYRSTPYSNNPLRNVDEYTFEGNTYPGCWGIHSTSSGDCAHLGGEMAYVMRCLGTAMQVGFCNLRAAINSADREIFKGIVGGYAHYERANSGFGRCEDDHVLVSKMGDSPWSSNHWQAVTYLTGGSPLRDTICWDAQHDKHQKKYWELGNDKSNAGDAPDGRFGILYSYHWRTGGGGGIQQMLTGDTHESCNITFSVPVPRYEGGYYDLHEAHGN